MTSTERLNDLEDRVNALCVYLDKTLEQIEVLATLTLNLQKQVDDLQSEE